MEKSHQTDSEKNSIMKNGLIIDLSNQVIDSSILDYLLDGVKNDNFFGDIKWPDNEIVSNYQKQIEEIESKLIKNNESFRMFPNDYVHCFISNKVYEDITENQKFEIHNETWKVYKVFSIPNIDTTDEKNKKITTKKGSIYSGAIFVNERKKQIVLAHRGININVYNFNNKNGPLEMNIEGILRNEYIPQLCYCYEITTKVNKIAKEKDYNLSFTGYSNGAWLAEYSIYFSKRLLKNDNVKAVLFESPGMLKDEGQFLSNNILSPENDFDLKEINTINYLTVPHLMNTSNKHTGKIYRLFIETNNKKDEVDKLNFLEKFISGITKMLKKKMETSNIGFFLKGLFSMFNNDYLELIIEQFDPKTGKPKYCEQMINWPLIHFEFTQSYQDNFKNSSENIIEKAIDYIPFIEGLEIIKDPSKMILKKISSFFIDTCAKQLMPGLHLLFNVIYEILSKEMVDLSLFENDIYYKKYNELDEGKDDQESYIELKYQNNVEINKDKTFHKRMIDFIFKKKKRDEKREKKKEIERRIEINENRFSLLFKNDFEPIILNENIKVLRIDSDSREIDWCLFNLTYLKSKESNKLADKFPSKLVYRQLINLQKTFSVETHVQDNVSCRDINVIVSLIENLTIDEIKDRLRLLLKMYQNEIKKLISESSKIQVSIHIEKMLKSDVVDFLDTTYYIKREEDKIIEEIINEKENKVFILSEVGGIGKTTMAKNIAKQLIEKYNFLVKVLNANNIEDKYRKILKEDCCYLDDKFKDKDFDLIDSINNELNIILKEKKELKVLFLIDNVKNDGEILKYIKGLPIQIKVLITTRQNDLLEDLQKKKVFGKRFLKSFGKNDAKNYFFNRNEIKKNFDEKRIDEFIEKLVNIEKITPLRLELAAKFISKSIKEFRETNKIMENLKTGVSDMEFTEIILKSLEKDDQTIEFLNYISFMDNSFISLDTIKLITNSDNITEILDKLDENGIIKKIRKNDTPGIEIHDIILNVIENNLKINFEIKQTIERNIIFKMNENISDIQQIKDKDWDMMEKNKKHIRKLFKNFQYRKTTIDSNILDLFEKLADYTSIAENSYEKSLTILEKIYEFSAIKTKTSGILQKIGLVYYNMGKYEKALDFYHKSLMMNEKIHSNRPDHPDFALTLNNIGLVYDKTGNFEKALEYYDKSLRIAQKVYLNEPDHPALATLFNNIGSVYNNMEKYEKAIEYYDKSLKINEKIHSNRPDHPDFALTLNNFGFVYKNMGKYEKALEYYDKSLKIAEKTYSNQPDHCYLATLLNNIGSVYKNMEKYEKALEYYYKSLKIREKIFCNQPDHPHLATLFNNFGFVYNNMGKYEKALENYFKSLKIKEKIHSHQPDHPDLSTSFINIGFVYKSMGKYEKALQYYDKSLKIRQKIYLNQPDHPDLATSFNNYGLVYDKIGKYEIALEYYNKSLKIREKIYSNQPDHPDLAVTFKNIGFVYRNMAKYEKALEYYDKSLKIKEKIYSDQPYHPDLATSFNNIGLVYDKLGNYEQALEYYDKSLKIKEKIHLDQPEHPNLATSFTNIGLVLQNMAKYEEALEYFEKSLNIRSKIYSNQSDHPALALSFNNIGLVYDKMGKYEKALEYYDKSLKIKEKIHLNQPNHPALATSYNNIGLVCFQLGFYEKALENYEKLLIINGKIHLNQPDHSDLATLFNNIGLVYDKSGKFEKALEFFEKSLRIKEKIYSNRPDHPDLATSFNNIGSVFKSLYKFEKALESYDKSLRIREKIYSNQPDHPDLASSFNNIGVVYKCMGKNEKALEYYDKSLKIREKIYSNQPDNRDLETTFNNIGFVFKKIGKYDKALENYNKSLKIREKIYSNQPDHPDLASSFNNIGLVYEKKGNYEKALEYFDKSLKIKEKIHLNQPDHPDLETSFKSIGNVYKNMENYEKALEFYDKSLEIKEKIYLNQPDHPDLTTSFNNIGLIYKNLGNYEKALEYYDRSLKIRQKIYSNQPDHPDLATSFKNIGLVYKNMGKYEKALEYFNKLLKNNEKIYTNQPDHPDLATSFNNFGLVYEKMGKYEKALEYYDKSLKIREKIYSNQPDHPALATSYNNIASVYNNMQNYEEALKYFNKSLKIKEKIYSNQPDHPDLATSFKNIGLVYDKMGNYKQINSTQLNSNQ